MTDVYYVVKCGSHHYLVRHNNYDHFVADYESNNVQILGCTSDKELISELEAEHILTPARQERLTKLPQHGHMLIDAHICYRTGLTKNERIPVGLLKVDEAIDISPPPK